MEEEKNPWQVIGEKLVYDNPWIKLTEFKVITPAQQEGIYGKVHFKNIAIGIIALDENNNTYLVGQYRFPLNKYSWEIPEGGCPEGTDPLLAAQRELKEETGLSASNWELILTMELSNSVSDEVAIVYLATGLKEGKAAPEDTEQLSILKMPFNEVFQWVMEEKITDAISVAAILKWQFLQSTKAK